MQTADVLNTSIIWLLSDINVEEVQKYPHGQTFYILLTDLLQIMEFKIFIQFTLWNVIFHFVICKDFSHQPNYSLIILARVFSNNVYEKIMLILV